MCNTPWRFVSGAALLSVVLLAACSCDSTPQSATQSKQQVTPVRIPLAANFECWWLESMEFSRDGQYIYLYNFTAGHRWAYEAGAGPMEGTVCDLSGRVFPEAVDAQGRLQGRFIDLFVAKSCGAGFSPDLSFRLVYPVSSAPTTAPQGSLAPAAELWQLQPRREMLWRSELPASFFGMEAARFFEREGQGYIFAAFKGAEGYVLSASDGRLVAKVAYGHIDTDEDGEAYKKKFHLRGYDDIDDLKFSAKTFSFDSSRRLLACGDSYTGRVRVISLDPPYRTVFEAHADENPTLRHSGNWKVERLQFAGGKYLIVELGSMARSLDYSEKVNEIYDVDTWQRVWLDKEPHNFPYVKANNIILSPDGRMMAYIRRGNLEIMPFVPGRGL